MWLIHSDVKFATNLVTSDDSLHVGTDVVNNEDQSLDINLSFTLLFLVTTK
jgi:hypothetical protein